MGCAASLFPALVTLVTGDGCFRPLPPPRRGADSEVTFRPAAWSRS